MTYLGVKTRDDLEGLVAEGKTIDEVLEITQDVAKVLLQLEKEIAIAINQDF